MDYTLICLIVHAARIHVNRHSLLRLDLFALIAETDVYSLDLCSLSADRLFDRVLDFICTDGLYGHLCAFRKCAFRCVYGHRNTTCAARKAFSRILCLFLSLIFEAFFRPFDRCRLLSYRIFRLFRRGRLRCFRGFQFCCCLSVCCRLLCCWSRFRCWCRLRDLFGCRCRCRFFLYNRNIITTFISKCHSRRWHISDDHCRAQKKSQESFNRFVAFHIALLLHLI